MTSEKLLHVLEDLGHKDFEDFKWFLQQPESLERFEAIKTSRLEKAEPRNTVTVMVQTYGDTAAVEVTRKVLEKIRRKDLVQRLSGSSSEPGVHQVEVESGAESVLLPCTNTCHLSADVRVEWRDREDHKVHVYQDGSAQLGEQHSLYIGRTQMKRNLLGPGDVSLTLKNPTDEDSGTFTCSVYREEKILMQKHVVLQVKGAKLQSGREDLACSLDTPRLEPGGVRCLTPGLRKYSCRLTIDTNTVNRKLQLSDNNRKVTCVNEDQSYPDHPDRFDHWWQLLCSNGLTGRCYWEVETRGNIVISVSYRGIRRKGDSRDCSFGSNDQSWSLICYSGCYYVRHNDIQTFISSSVSDRVSVFVDCPAGSLSFYSVSSDKLIHLHTFTSTFTEPLYPGFVFMHPGSSVSLCDV